MENRRQDRPGSHRNLIARDPDIEINRLERAIDGRDGLARRQVAEQDDGEGGRHDHPDAEFPAISHDPHGTDPARNTDQA